MKLALASAAFGGVGPAYAASGKRANKPQRTVVIMFDGFGLDYLQQSDMPILRRWQRDGVYQQVRGVMPSVTNANNASICCGCFPREHGITGNSYFDMTADHEEYMEAADLLLAPTLFEHGAKLGVSSALLSSKKKTISLLRRGTATSLTAEEPSAEWVDRLGPAPPIYSREINYWIVRAAIYILKHEPEIQCLYVHTTDYPMHTWAPDAAESKEHLKTVDALLGEAYEAAPDAQFLLTADHGMNHKTRAYDLERSANRVSFHLRTKAERGGQNLTPHSVPRQRQKDLPPRRLLCSSTRGSDPNHEQRAAIQLDILSGPQQDAGSIRHPWIALPWCVVRHQDPGDRRGADCYLSGFGYDSPRRWATVCGRS